MSRRTLPALALLLCACRNHPCGDEEASAPAKMAELPLVQEGGKICHSYEGDGTNMNRPTATVMYWGDHMAELRTQYVGAFDKAGWEQTEQCGREALCFTKGEQRVDLEMTQTKTPRLGSAMEKPSISVMAFYAE